MLEVWQEAYRVLKPGGTLAAGFVNPVVFLFDRDLEEKGVFQLKYFMPYSDAACLPPEALAQLKLSHAPLEFAHSLDDQIGGQLRAGFKLMGLYEDDWGGAEAIDRHFKAYIATRAEKPV